MHKQISSLTSGMQRQARMEQNLIGALRGATGVEMRGQTMNRGSTAPQIAGSTTVVSMSDLQNLRQRLKDSNFQWTALTNAERWRYHAYDYAFLMTHCGLRDQKYPLDPDGKWFDAALVDAAERIYQPPPRPLKDSIPRSEVE